MGANAQTSVPTFTAGQVLTAAQMNDSARTGVPVFADTTARDAAFGGTGEKTLAEGQLAYIESLDVVQYYSGASWLTVGPQTLTSGMNYITGNTIGAVSSVSLPNSTFTTTYRNYLIVFDCEFSTNANLQMRMRASGTDNTTGNYNWAITNTNTGGTVAGQGTAADSLWRFGYGASATNRSAALTFTVYGPQTATITRVSAYGFSADNNYNASATISSAGVFTATTQFDAISFIAPFSSGNYRVYGLADS